MQISRRSGETGTRDGKGRPMARRGLRDRRGKCRADTCVLSELFGWDIRLDETGYGLVDTGSGRRPRRDHADAPQVSPYLTFVSRQL